MLKSAIAQSLVCAIVIGETHRLPFRDVIIHASFLSCLAYWLTLWLVPHFGLTLKDKGLFGRDLGKLDWRVRRLLFEDPKGKREFEEDGVEQLVQMKKVWEASEKIPESLGVVVGFVFLMCSFLMLLKFKDDIKASLDFVAGILAICFVTFLGFADDVMDLRWRYKLIIPLFASIPLLAIYHGPTYILVPNILKPIFSRFFNLPVDPIMGILVWEMGRLYYVYIACLTIFCTNSINIYAGLNGLEVGQSIIIAFGIMIHNLMELRKSTEHGIYTMYEARHLYSLVISMIFVSGSLALFHFNKYPSKVFIGDTYTYFAGVFFAVAGIMGHFSKTLLLFFLPQILNFVYSLPQLFGIVECPRHRLPYFDSKKQKLISNGSLTTLNLCLQIFGPMKEKTLVSFLFLFQICCCLLALLIRYSPIWNVAFL